jgi:cytochrome bd-type quinol oxidase subunit 2
MSMKAKLRADLTVLASAVCFVHRPTAIAMGRFRVRARRTEMWWHLLVIPMLLAIVIWTALESPLGGIDDAYYKLVLMASLSTAGWVVYCLTNLFKRVFQSFQNNRNKDA